MGTGSVLPPARTSGGRSSTLAEQVYLQIKTAILTCKLKPGQMVYESEMIQEYGVSKTPVREALKQLTQERLIQSIPGTCYLVTPVTVKDVDELWEMRAILEEVSATRAASRATEAQLRELESKMGEIFTIRENDDLVRWYDQNTAFHLALAEITRNSRLVSTLRSVLNEISRFLLLDPEMPANTSQWIRQHQRILDALKKRDGALAIAVTLEDMQASQPRIEKAIYSPDR
jgi:DNA-binding GntR family transcriptional regulator